MSERVPEEGPPLFFCAHRRPRHERVTVKNVLAPAR
jgi:hypothetical protein